MRKNVIDNVEIVEPPIGELTRQRGSIKRTFLTGCGCVIFLVIFLIAGLKLFVGPGPKDIKSLPGNFPSSVPVYEKDAIENITFISGKYKNRSTEIAAFFPKIILSPLLLKTKSDSQKNSEGFFEANKNFWKFLTTPIGDSRDTVQIEWGNMNAEPTFIISYYIKELDKNNFEISEISNESNSYQITFSRIDGISGTLFASGKKEGTDYAFLTINIPSGYQDANSQK